MSLLSELIAAKLTGGGGGSSVTPASIVTATGQMTAAQAAETRGNLNAAPAETVQTVSGATPTITPVANTIYDCGELTSLTISNPPATGSYSIVFTSGATATDCDFPDSLQWQNDTVPAINPNKTYEIIVTNNRAVCGEFPVAGVTP